MCFFQNHALTRETTRFMLALFFLAAGRSCRQWCPEVWLSAIAVIFLPMKSLTTTTANENRTARGLVLYAIT